MSLVPGVIAVIIGGSVGRGEHWPLSDIDLMVVSADRPVQEVATDVDMCAYRISEMWGTTGIYTAVDAGKITFDVTEARRLCAGSSSDTASALSDARVLHGIDKMFGGYTTHDPSEIGAALLDWSARYRFSEPVTAGRTSWWLSQAETAAEAAEHLAATDPIGAWIMVRRAGTSLAEAALERRGLRTGSLGRFWTRFERLLAAHRALSLAEQITSACCATVDSIDATDWPEWLSSRIDLSLAARWLTGEKVTAVQNVRDTVLAYAGLYRGRFPRAVDGWLRPSEPAGIDLASARLHELRRQV
jgi:hypothetical protein